LFHHIVVTGAEVWFAVIALFEFSHRVGMSSRNLTS